MNKRDLEPIIDYDEYEELVRGLIKIESQAIEVQE